MNYAFIKDDVCFNIAVFEDLEQARAFQEVMQRDGLLDKVVELPIGFGVGDKYLDGIWSKAEHTPVPTEAERLRIVEENINMLIELQADILGGAI